ncbi:hypothetical protein VTL71DRAFT_5956, partial [Oculimacula yallundae]
MEGQNALDKSSSHGLVAKEPQTNKGSDPCGIAYKIGQNSDAEYALLRLSCWEISAEQPTTHQAMSATDRLHLRVCEQYTGGSRAVIFPIPWGMIAGIRWGMAG